jgi:hypothetical protein
MYQITFELPVVCGTHGARMWVEVDNCATEGLWVSFHTEGYTVMVPVERIRSIVYKPTPKAAP